MKNDKDEFEQHAKWNKDHNFCKEKQEIVYKESYDRLTGKKFKSLFYWTTCVIYVLYNLYRNSCPTYRQSGCKE